MAGCCQKARRSDQDPNFLFRTAMTPANSSGMSRSSLRVSVENIAPRPNCDHPRDLLSVPANHWRLVVEAWQFRNDQVDDAVAFYRDNGAVGFPDLLDEKDVKYLNSAYDEAVAGGSIRLDPEAMLANPDAIYRHPAFEEYCRDDRIVDIVEKLLNGGVELQHSKLNAKPGSGAAGGTVEWHQDYPFFAHTNFDLLTCTIHLDEEKIESGPLEVIPGSHKRGIEPHEDESGKFVYHYTGPSLEGRPSILMTGKAGQVTMHHVLSLHRSAPRRSATQRRHLIFEYRAEDSVQISGVVTKCAGLTIRDRGKRGYARFMDGTSVRLRGNLIDLHRKFAPDR